ncbi:MAG: histidinol phosphate phosphatase domain-containing protein [Halobacteriales archaeon]
MTRIDLHTHTFASDGELLPAELARRAAAAGIDAICIADHAGPSNVEDVVDRSVAAASALNGAQPVRIVPGVELTHLPPAMIADVALRARDAGAELVLVHGETIAEPVVEGTNRAAIEAGAVDLLAHPGLLTTADAERAAETGTVLELTSRRGHCLTNGRVAREAARAGAPLVVNTDAHAPSDLLGYDDARKIAAGAGLDDPAIEAALETTPRELLEALG